MEASFWIGLGVLVLDFVVRIVAIIVIPRDRRPTAAMAWLLAVFFIPVIGVLLFLLIGNYRLPEARRLKQLEMNETIAARTASLPRPQGVDNWPAALGGAVALSENLTAMPMVGGNQADLIGEYDESLAAMTAEIAAATREVHVEFYIMSLDAATGPFFDALAAAVRRAVKVEVLLDHWASSHCRDYKVTIERLTVMGADWRLMLPVQPLKGKYQRLDLRNHRKLLVVDGRVAFIGSQNVIDRSYNKSSNIKRGLQWKELMVRVEGPVVQAIDLVFLTDWYMEGGPRPEAGPGRENRTPQPGTLDCQVVPSGPGFEVENNLQLFLTLVYGARERVVITSPYFVPEESMIRAILAATGRGVTVDLFVSEIGDQALVWHAQRSYYEALLRAGVRIFQYPPPAILHAKHFTIDDDVAVIGSSNMDMRSFGLNSEISLVVRSRSAVEQMRAVEQGYREVSKELTLEAWGREPLRATILDGLARLTSSLQ